MIPRGADFPPNSAPPAKRREPATMRHDRPALPAAPPRAVRLPTDRRAAQLRARTRRVATLRRPNARHCSALAARHDAGSVRPGHGPHGNSVDFVAFLRRLGSPPTRSTRLAARPTAPEKRQLFLLPKALRRPRQSGKRPRFLQRTFLNFSTQKRTGSVTSRFSLWILFLAAAFSLLNISSRRFPRGFGSAESAFRHFRS